MNRFDQAARYGAKQLDAAGFLLWLVARAFAGWTFRGWLDTRTVTFPGEGDRICDTVAEFERNDGSGDRVAPGREDGPVGRDSHPVRPDGMGIPSYVRIFRAQGNNISLDLALIDNA